MSAHSTTPDTPDIADLAARIGRTAVQAGTAVVTGAATLGAVYAAIEPITGPLTRGNIAGWFVGAIFAVAGNAALLARLMALPGVNALLSRVKLGAVSPAASAPSLPVLGSGAADTETRAIALLSAPAGH